MAQGPIDLIRLAGEGNSVVLRIHGREQARGARTSEGRDAVMKPVKEER